MTFSVSKASDWNYSDEVEITTMEELISFIEEHGEIIINESHITIYDYYVE